MAEDTEKKGYLTVVAIDVTNGKITKVKGVEQAKVAEMNDALEKLGFEVPEERDLNEVQKQLSQPNQHPIFIVHTHSSPGCEWVYQDGRWRKVCN